MTFLLAPHAHLPDGVRAEVLLEIVDGRFASVRAEVPPAEVPAATRRLGGTALPGFANAHSHAFHRALRGRTHVGGTFWTWREAMYTVAGRLDPDSYLELARAVYAEMALAGVTTVGEFHYLHHAPGGRRYADPNAMGEALRQAAADAGIRLTLLDTAYLAGGLAGSGHVELEPPQLRFGDGDVHRWAERVATLRGSAGFRVGAAVHSVRAVPAADLPVVVQVARAGLGGRACAPLHVHLSEQPAENDACRAHHGCTPTELLAEAGAWGPDATAVHATHLTPTDIAVLGRSGTTACFCPTTERDLADGIGPARALLDAGCALSLGSDQHAVIDLLEEARALEMHERLATRSRGRFRPDQLLAALTAHRSLGWPDAGRIEAGARADLVVLRTETVATAGSRPEQLLLTAGRSDVDAVYVDGAVAVADGEHRLGDVGGLLARALQRIWAPA